MTTPSLYGAGAGASGTGNISVPFPATVPSGMDALLCIMTANQPPANLISGWQQLDTSPQGVGPAGAYPDSVALSVYAKKTTGAEGGTSVPIADSGTFTVGIIYLVADASSDAPINAIAGATHGFTTVPSIVGPNTTADGCFVLTMFAAATTAAYTTSEPTSTDLTGYAKIGDYGSIALAGGVKPSAGATGTFQMRASVSSRWAMFAIAFAPQPQGLPSITGAMTPAETGRDDATAAIEAIIRASAQAGERGGDRSAVVGAVQARGHLLAGEMLEDRASLRGSAVVSGEVAVIGERTDALLAAGGPAIFSALAVAELGDDAFAAVGAGAIDEAPAPITGSMTGRESGDESAHMSAQTLLGGQLQVAEQFADRMRAAAAADVEATLSIIEGGSDRCAMQMHNLVAGNLTAAGTSDDALYGAFILRIDATVGAVEWGADHFRAFGPAADLEPLPSYRVASAPGLSRRATVAGMGRAARSAAAQLGV